MDILDELNRLLRPVWNAVRGLTFRSVITSVTDEAKKIQVVSIQRGAVDEVLSDVERVQNFGFTSHPKPGSQAIVISVGGNTSHPVVIAVDDANYRIVVDEGEVAIYNAFGAVIKLGADKTISLGDDSQLLATAGVVTGECIDSFTGAPYADKSSIVKAKKV